MKGDPLPYGFHEGDLVEYRHGEQWIAGKLVAGTSRRNLRFHPLSDPATTHWVDNPAKLRRMTQERLEAWLESEDS